MDRVKKVIVCCYVRLLDLIRVKKMERWEHLWLYDEVVFAHDTT